MVVLVVLILICSINIYAESEITEESYVEMETITVLAIMKVLLPMILKGFNPIPISIIISVGITITGSTIPMLLLFMAYETSMVKIMNLDIIATEIIRSLSGSIGLVLTIPLTAFSASVLIKRNDKRNSHKSNKI